MVLPCFSEAKLIHPRIVLHLDPNSNIYPRVYYGKLGNVTSRVSPLCGSGDQNSAKRLAAKLPIPALAVIKWPKNRDTIFSNFAHLAADWAFIWLQKHYRRRERRTKDLGDL